MNVRVFLVKASCPLVFLLTTVGCGSTSAPSESAERAPAVDQLPIEGAQSCNAAHEWTKANAARLPTSYDAIARYSIVYRKAIFSAATPAVRVNLWKEHLGRYRAEHALSAEQASVLDRALALIDSELPSSELRSSSVLKELKADALKLFGRNGTRELFATLGPANTPSSAASQEGSAWECQCSVESSYCPNWGYCDYPGSTPCEGSSMGCGDFWLYPCDGICFY